MSKKGIGMVGIALILITIIIGILKKNQYWKIAAFERTNNELVKKLENTTQELESLQKDYTDLQKILNANLNPPIETRLGIRLMENGLRFKTYL